MCNCCIYFFCQIRARFVSGGGKEYETGSRRKGDPMVCNLADLRKKDVINLVNGENLGYVDDIELETGTSAVTGLILYGRPRCFGLLGRQEDCTIRTEQIRLIGKDTILVFLEEDGLICTKK